MTNSQYLQTAAVTTASITLVLLLVALGHARFLEGIGRGSSISMGLFSSCYDSECEHDAFAWAPSWALYSVREQWHTYQAFLLTQVVVHGLCLIAMKNRLVWAAHKPAHSDAIKRWLPRMQLVVILFGAVALALVCTVKPRMEKDLYATSLRFGASLKLQIAAYPITVVAFFLYSIGWRYESKEIEENTASTPATPSLHDLQPQQVAININGQIVMATITPSQPAQVSATYQPAPVSAAYQQAPVVYIAQHPVPAQMIQQVQSPYGQQQPVQGQAQTYAYPQYSSNVQVNNPPFNPQAPSMTYPLIHPNVNSEPSTTY